MITPNIIWFFLVFSIEASLKEKPAGRSTVMSGILSLAGRGVKRRLFVFSADLYAADAAPNRALFVAGEADVVYTCLAGCGRLAARA